MDRLGPHPHEGDALVSCGEERAELRGKALDLLINVTILTCGHYHDRIKNKIPESSLVPGLDEILPAMLKALDVVGLSWFTRLFGVAWRIWTTSD